MPDDLGRSLILVLDKTNHHRRVISALVYTVWIKNHEEEKISYYFYL